MHPDPTASSSARRRHVPPTPPPGSYMVVRDPVRLRARMREAGFTYEDLARAARVDRSYVSHLLPPEIERPAFGQPRCAFKWHPTAHTSCIGRAGHRGQHASTARARRRTVGVDVGHRIATALTCRVEHLFELRTPEDPSTGPLTVPMPALPIDRRRGDGQKEPQ